MAARKKTPKRRARKATSDRVSTIAARLLRAATEAEKIGERFVIVELADVKSVCASALGQDETPRKRRAS